MCSIPTVPWPTASCTVELRIPRKTPSLIVPGDAIIFDRNGLQVAVVEKRHYPHPRDHRDPDLGTTAEVRDGVKSGDR
jgi:hypothetical protein